MTRAVGDVLDQLAPRALARDALVEQVAEQVDDIEVGHFGVAPDVVHAAGLAGFEHALDGAAVIGDEQPVASLLPVAVHGQLLAFQGVDEHQRNQLLGKLERPVVVRAVGDHHRQAVGAVPGPGQVIGRRLGGRVGRIRSVTVRFGEGRLVGRERAVDLVSRHVHETEMIRPAAPVLQRAIEQRLRAGDVGADERTRLVDRAIDVALGGEVHDRVGPMLGEQTRNQRTVADIALHEDVPVVGQALERFAIAGVGQQVQVDHPGIARAEQVMNEVGPDESGTAGDKNRAHWLFNHLKNGTTEDTECTENRDAQLIGDAHCTRKGPVYQ